MPKKTKKEKLLASYPKKIRLLEKKQTITPVISSPSPVPVVKQEIKNFPVNQYFFSDLKKSIILTTLIIGLEISLYFVKLIK